MAETPAEPPQPWHRYLPGIPSGEFTIEWTPPDGEVIAPGAFAAAIGKPVRGNNPTGTQIGTLISVDVAPDGGSAKLTIRASDAGDT